MKVPVPIDIFKEVKALGFPSDQYIVVGSGIMAAKGIRDTSDLDIVVTPELFEEYKSKGWEIHPWTKESIPGKAWLKKGNIELYEQFSRKAGAISARELLKGAEIIQGIPFITLESLIDFKREYGRPKDFEDIRIIEDYLRT